MLRAVAVGLIGLAIVVVMNGALREQRASEAFAQQQAEQQLSMMFNGPGPGCEPAPDVPLAELTPEQQQAASQQRELDPKQREQNAQVLIDTAWTSISENKLDQALYQLSQAHAMLHALVEDYPENDEWRIALAKSKESCTTVLVMQDKLAASKLMHQQARRLRLASVEHGNTTAESYHDLAATTSSLATELNATKEASEAMDLRGEALIGYSRAALMDKNNKDYEKDRVNAGQEFSFNLGQQPLPIQLLALSKLQQQAADLEKQLPQAAAGVYFILSADYLEILQDEQQAFASINKAMHLLSDPNSEQICSHAEASLAAGRKDAEIIANSQRCVDSAIFRNEKVVGLALEYAARVFAGQKKQAHKNARELQDALMVLGDHSLNWSFAGTRAALEKWTHPQAKQVAKLFAALEISDETQRAKATDAVIRGIRSVAR